MSEVAVQSDVAASSRNRIVDGAARAFAERGIRDTTVEHILVAAKTSRRTFYKYFHGKEDALRAVYERETDALLGAVQAAVRDTADPMQKVAAAMDAYLSFLEQQGPLLTALQAEAVRPDSLLAARRATTLDALVELVDGAVAEHVGVRVDPLVYRGLLIGIEGLVIHVVADGALTGAAVQRVRSVIGPMFLNVLMGARYLPPPPE